MMNKTKKPYDDMHVRRAISYAIDREALVKSVLFGNGTVANSFMMPSAPYYDKDSPGLSTTWPRPRRRWPSRACRRASRPTCLAMSGDAVDASIAQILQASLKELGITMDIQNVDPSAQHDLTGKLQYEIAHSYWTMDLADPDELAQFALDPTTGGHSFNTGFNDKEIIELVHKAQQEFDKDQAPGAVQPSSR